MNCAGIMRAINLFEQADNSLGALTEEININLLGTIAVTQAFWKFLSQIMGWSLTFHLAYQIWLTVRILFTI